MAVPALSKSRKNNTLRKWLRFKGDSGPPGWAGYRLVCWLVATNPSQIGPIPTPGASQFTDTIEPISPSC